MLAAACGSADAGGGEQADGPQTIRFTWWGNEDRAQLTEQAVDLFEKQNPDITVQTSFSPFAGYFDKLSTETAGGSAPDVFQMDFRYLNEYGTRGVLLDLSGQDQSLDLSGFDPSFAESGQIDGQQVAIPFGQNTATLLVDEAAFAAAGALLPGGDYSWDDLLASASAVTKATGGQVYGLTDFGWSEDVFEVWLRQQGGVLYEDDGTFGFGEEELTEFWELAERFRAEGASTPADITAAIDGSAEAAPLGRGLSAAEFTFDSQATGFISTTGKDLTLQRYPSDGDELGQYRKPSMLLSASAQSEAPDAAVRLIDFLVNDPEAGQLLGTTRGMPPNTEVRETLGETLEGVDALVYEFESTIDPDLSDTPIAPPPGDGEVQAIIQRLNEEISFGRLSIDEAVAQFFTEANAAIG
jgi:multiple sugar transport system substrate-binding protein